MQDLSDYEVPVHRSLISPILLMGLPRSVAFVLWTLATALGMGMRQLWVFPIALCIHLPLVLLTKKEPHFFSIFIRSLKAPDRMGV